MLKVLLFALVVVAGLAILYFYFYLGFGRTLPPATKAKLIIRGAMFDVELADTAARRTQGLSGRSSLPADTGLYFIFPSTSTYGFWMKDMLFPIDIIWITNNKVVGVTANVMPEPGVSMFKLKVYYPPAPVDRVLEVNSGVAAKYGIAAGDEVGFTPTLIGE